MHAHWTTGGGRTGAIAAAHVHRTSGRWPGVKSAVRAWLGAEKHRLTEGNKKHPIVMNFGPREATEWIRAVVDKAKRTYRRDVPGGARRGRQRH